MESLSDAYAQCITRRSGHSVRRDLTLRRTIPVDKSTSHNVSITSHLSSRLWLIRVECIVVRARGGSFEGKIFVGSEEYDILPKQSQIGVVITLRTNFFERSNYIYLTNHAGGVYLP